MLVVVGGLDVELGLAVGQVGLEDELAREGVGILPLEGHVDTLLADGAPELRAVLDGLEELDPHGDLPRRQAAGRRGVDVRPRRADVDAEAARAHDADARVAVAVDAVDLDVGPAVAVRLGEGQCRFVGQAVLLLGLELADHVARELDGELEVATEGLVERHRHRVGALGEGCLGAQRDGGVGPPRVDDHLGWRRGRAQVARGVAGRDHVEVGGILREVLEGEPVAGHFGERLGVGETGQRFARFLDEPEDRVADGIGLGRRLPGEVHAGLLDDLGRHAGDGLLRADAVGGDASRGGGRSHIARVVDRGEEVEPRAILRRRVVPGEEIGARDGLDGRRSLDAVGVPLGAVQPIAAEIGDAGRPLPREARLPAGGRRGGQAGHGRRRLRVDDEGLALGDLGHGQATAVDALELEGRRAVGRVGPDGQLARPLTAFGLAQARDGDRRAADARDERGRAAELSRRLEGHRRLADADGRARCQRDAHGGRLATGPQAHGREGPLPPLRQLPAMEAREAARYRYRHRLARPEAALGRKGGAVPRRVVRHLAPHRPALRAPHRDGAAAHRARRHGLVELHDDVGRERRAPQPRRRPCGDDLRRHRLLCVVEERAQGECLGVRDGARVAGRRDLQGVVARGIGLPHRHLGAAVGAALAAAEGAEPLLELAGGEDLDHRVEIGRHVDELEGHRRRLREGKTEPVDVALRLDRAAHGLPAGEPRGLLGRAVGLEGRVERLDADEQPHLVEGPRRPLLGLGAPLGTTLLELGVGDAQGVEARLGGEGEVLAAALVHILRVVERRDAGGGDAEVVAELPVDHLFAAGRAEVLGVEHDEALAHLPAQGHRLGDPGGWGVPLWLRWLDAIDEAEAALLPLREVARGLVAAPAVGLALRAAGDDPMVGVGGDGLDVDVAAGVVDAEGRLGLARAVELDLAEGRVARVAMVRVDEDLHVASGDGLEGEGLAAVDRLALPFADRLEVGPRRRRDLELDLLGAALGVVGGVVDHEAVEAHGLRAGEAEDEPVGRLRPRAARPRPAAAAGLGDAVAELHDGLAAIGRCLRPVDERRARLLRQQAEGVAQRAEHHEAAAALGVTLDLLPRFLAVHAEAPRVVEPVEKHGVEARQLVHRRRLGGRAGLDAGEGHRGRPPGPSVDLRVGAAGEIEDLHRLCCEVDAVNLDDGVEAGRHVVEEHGGEARLLDGELIPVDVAAGEEGFLDRLVGGEADGSGRAVRQAHGALSLSKGGVVGLELAVLGAEGRREGVAAGRPVRHLVGRDAVGDADQVGALRRDGQIERLGAAVAPGLGLVEAADGGAGDVEQVLELRRRMVGEGRMSERLGIEHDPALAHALDERDGPGARVRAVGTDELEARLAPARPQPRALRAAPARELRRAPPVEDPVQRVGGHGRAARPATLEGHAEEGDERLRAVELHLADLRLRLVAVVRRDLELHRLAGCRREAEDLALVAVGGDELPDRAQRLGAVADEHLDLLRPGARGACVVVEHEAVEAAALAAEAPGEGVGDLRAAPAAPAAAVLAGHLVAVGGVGRVPAVHVVLAARRDEHAAHLRAVLRE